MLNKIELQYIYGAYDKIIQVSESEWLKEMQQEKQEVIKCKI